MHRLDENKEPAQQQNRHGAAWALAAALLLALAAAGPASGQSSPAPASSSDTTSGTTKAARPLVTGVRFEGNRVFSDGALQQRVRTAPNRRILGIPGLTWWRWLYGFGGFIGGGVGDAFQRVGEAPARLNRSVLTDDAGRLQAFYRQEGFREAVVTPEVQPAGSPGEVKVLFRIRPGPALHARRVRYAGLGALTPAQRQRLAERSLLRADDAPVQGRPDTLRFRADGRRYSETRLLNERSRLLDALRNEGYARVTRDSVRALIFPQPSPGTAPDSFDVTFRLRPGPRYRVGDIHFRVSGPEAGAPVRIDTLEAPEDAPGTVTARIEGDSKIEPSLLWRLLRLRPGRWYRHEDLLATKRRLEATGVFSFTDLRPLAPTRPDTAAAPSLPHRIELRTRPRHSIRLETFALQRAGVLSESGELGFGVGATYENANLSGQGETFRTRVAGSVASDFDTDDGPGNVLFSSAQLEASTSLTYPYLVRPFSGLERLFDLYDARTQLSLNLLTARRENLGFLIRGRGQARLRLQLRHTATLTSLVDLVDISLSNPDTLAGFQTFLNRIIGPPEDPIVTDPVQRARIREDYTAPQINTALRYTLRASTANPLLRARGYSYEASAEVGNTLPALLDRTVFSPDTVESSLPELPLLGGGDSRLRYRPYVRFVGDARRYLPLGPGTVLAGKFILGLAHPTGRPGVVPFDRRFYSGGASSVRGWALRELRPADTDTLSGDVPNLLGGDVKLEASLELRQTLFENLLSTDWIFALFTDAGNAWIGPRNPGAPETRFRFGRFYKQLGVGSGLGLRLSWDYLVLRLDMAFKVHDPLQRGNPFPDGLSEPRLHFGIGHAF